MARNPRQDHPGSWHHVMNRAIARRSLFESRDDIRYFQACLAKAVRRGQIEVHSWTAVTTHFHLLVWSRNGQLSEAMCRVQNAYSRYFNRSRNRDGPLVRGRFRSKPVTTLAYREMLVRYIDRNPVEAGLAVDPCEYPFGSASAYANRSGPPWLTRSWVEEAVCGHLGSSKFDPIHYASVFGEACSQPTWDLVEQRILSKSNVGEVDALDHLVNGAPENVRRWLEANTKLADGSRPGLPVADPVLIRDVIARERKRDAWTPVDSIWTPSIWSLSRNWELLEIGLLRDLTGATLRDIGSRVGLAEGPTARRYDEYRVLLKSNEDYAAVAAGVSTRILREVVGIADGEANPV